MPAAQAPTPEVAPAADRPHLQHHHHPAGGSDINVGTMERVVSVLAGGGLAFYGLIRNRMGGLALSLLGGGLLYRGLTGSCPIYHQLGVNSSIDHAPAIGVMAQHGYRLKAGVTVNCPREELYRFWRNLENLPKVMSHLRQVQVFDEKRSRWVAWGPLHTTVEWDAEIHTDRENELISWRSLPGSDVDTAGSVHFEPAPGNRGTAVRVSIKYDPPGGKVGANIASLLGSGLEQEMHEDLRQFKQMMEAGEVPTTQGQPVGPPSSRQKQGIRAWQSKIQERLLAGAIPGEASHTQTPPPETGLIAEEVGR